MEAVNRFVPYPMPTLYEKEYPTEYLDSDTQSLSIREDPAEFLRKQCRSYLDVVHFATAMGVIEDGEVYLRFPELKEEKQILTPLEVLRVDLAISDFKWYDKCRRLYTIPVQLAREFCKEWEYAFCVYFY